MNLPLNAGTLDVSTGLMAGISASFTLSGSYQIRVRRLPTGAVELSFLRARGAKLEVGFNAAASASVTFRDTDLASALLGAICKTTTPANLLQGLQPEEIEAFNAAVKEGVQHSLKASLDLELSTADEHQVAFQYELDLQALDETSTAAVNRALRGKLMDLSGAGIKLIDSVVSRAQTTGATLKVNLLGIVNLISLSKLMSNCEVLFEPASGDLTIKETAQQQRIGALTDQLKRDEALRKALFESVLVTTTYRAAKAVSQPELDCQSLHFVLNRNTSPANIHDYLNWFEALRLIPHADAATLFAQYGGDKTSACVLRAAFNDAACEQLFLAGGKPRPQADYLDCGRRALRAISRHPPRSSIARVFVCSTTTPPGRPPSTSGPAPNCATSSRSPG